MANVLPSKIKYNENLSLTGKVATLYNYADYIQEQVEWYTSVHHLSELYDLVNTAQATADEAVEASTTEEIVRKMEATEVFYTTGDVAVTQSGETTTFTNSNDTTGNLAVISFSNKYKRLSKLSVGDKVRVEGTLNADDEEKIFNVVAVDGGYQQISLRGKWSKTGKTTGTVRVINRTAAENNTNVDLKYRIHQAELKVTDEAITATVTSSKEWTNLGTRVESAEAAIASDSIQLLIKSDSTSSVPTDTEIGSFSSAMGMTSKAIEFLVKESDSTASVQNSEGGVQFSNNVNLAPNSDQLCRIVFPNANFKKWLNAGDTVRITGAPSSDDDGLYYVHSIISSVKICLWGHFKKAKTSTAAGTRVSIAKIEGKPVLRHTVSTDGTYKTRVRVDNGTNESGTKDTGYARITFTGVPFNTSKKFSVGQQIEVKNCKSGDTVLVADGVYTITKVSTGKLDPTDTTPNSSAYAEVNAYIIYLHFKATHTNGDADNYQCTVTPYDEDASTALMACLKASSDKITSLVENDTSYSQLVQQADSIETVVSNKDGQLISRINQGPASVKIQAKKIELSGYVTISDLASSSGSTIINGSHIKTGYITDSQGQNYWNLDSGYLSTNNINVTGGVINLGGFTLTKDAIYVVAHEAASGVSGYSVNISGANIYSSGSGGTMNINDGKISFNSGTCYIQGYASGGYNYDSLYLYAATQTKVGNYGANITIGGSDASVIVTAAGGLRVRNSATGSTSRVATVAVIGSVSQLPASWTYDGIIYMVAE